MNDVIGTVRREDHEGGFSLWLLMQNWDESEPSWRCVYSTASGNVGHIWTCDDASIEAVDCVTQCSIKAKTTVSGSILHFPVGQTNHGAHATVFDIPGWPCPPRVRDIVKTPNSWGYAMIHRYDIGSMVVQDELGYLWADGQATPGFKLPDEKYANPGGVVFWTEKGLGLWIHPKTYQHLGEMSRLDMEPDRWVPIAVVYRELPEFVSTSARLIR
jgi:hypothetical protein